MKGVLNGAPLILFVAVVAVFGAQSPKFLAADNFINILVQAAPTAIVAVGMTFVLLSAGVDLSVGAIMFVAAAVVGKLTVQFNSIWPALLVMTLTGILFGALNAALITWLRLIPFVVTLAMQFIGRGLALNVTETRSLSLPDYFLSLGTERWLGIPAPIWWLAAVVGLAQGVLTFTPFGRQLYAVGQDAEAARKAGVHPRRVIAAVYVISGFCAAVGGILALAQLGTISPKFGENKEFMAIAAAVLGGTSLFGGRGKVFPGTVMGAILIQTIENGLVMVNANPYLYPLITSAIIFVAVLVDSTRSRWLAQWSRRWIRREEEGAVS
ncbi:ABC transporter permease [Fontisphaera persica]|uniref:ABC transporter permease n=1 Tax=Fontisphaera persica TaxID=2974023 RepID=UPI0024C06956|nr:ABC transporter permease [Fontisphaera persica]WCJ60203.1 ABC transporter permease [Fontisphaera persica]